MRLKNTPKNLENETYTLNSTKIRGQNIPKSFWKRMSNKAKISIIATIAAAALLVPTISNGITAQRYPDISGYEIIVENISDKNTLDYWISEYNNEADNDHKDYIITQFADYTREVKEKALNKVKRIIVDKLKDSDHQYSEIGDISDIRINYNFNNSSGEETISVNNIGLDIEMSSEMESVVREVANLQSLENNNSNPSKEDIGRQVVRILCKENDLNNYRFTAKNTKQFFTGEEKFKISGEEKEER